MNSRPAHRLHAGTAHTAALALAFALAGCASGSSNDGPSFSLPDMPSLSVSSIAEPSEVPKGSATELYARIATGANSCWFGTNGPLKKEYIYHAEADAPSRGGKAEIVIHQRDPGAQNPRGPKAYRIAIAPKDETSATIATENLKMSEQIAAAMNGDVDRWAKGDQGCKGNSTTVGWAPDAAPAAAGPAAKQPATRSKAASPTKKPAPKS